MTFVEWFASLTVAAQWLLVGGFIAGIVAFCWLLLVIDRTYQRSQDRANAWVGETALLAVVPAETVEMRRLRTTDTEGGGSR